jgi:UrcA family protein
MSRKTRTSGTTTGLALLTAGLLVAGTAGAAEPLEVVVVEAAREATVGQTSTGVPIKEITIRSKVSYADLDLTSATGALELEKRIRDTATSSCKEIKVDYPVAGSTDAACIKKAVDGAMVEARKAIDAKRKAAAK